METKPRAAKQLDPVNEWLTKSDDFARREPAKAVVSALGAGFLINLLPIGTIVGALVSLLLATARPILLFLGLLKAADLLRQKSKSHL